jgi:iron-sulfur cluster repair protein YtfE (RIC family)
MPATPLTKQTYALSLSSELLEPHMHAEETLLEPLIVGRDAEIDALLARLRAEHVSLREQIQALPYVGAAISWGDDVTSRPSCAILDGT